VDPSRIHDAFPAPDYRGAQEQALDDVRAAFEAGNDVVLVRAPTGSGKSLLARAIAGCARQANVDDPTKPVGAYYTTPQVSQLDDVAADPLLSDLSIVRGKGNYKCILPGETDTPVNRAPCVRETDFDCQVKHRCPYFSDREIAANRAIAAMTLAYFMQTAGSDVFGQRDVVVIDEAHGLGTWAEMYATVELGPDTVPVWDEVTPPEIGDLDDAAARAVIRQAFEQSAATHALVAEDHPNVRDVVTDLGYRVIGETWLRETTGVPLARVRRLEAEVATVEAGLRFGEAAVDADECHDVTLPARLVETARGIDQDATLEAIHDRSVAYVTDQGGSRPAERVVLAAGSDSEELVEALADVLRQRYDAVERDGDDLVARETVFYPERAATLGVPEGPKFGRLAAGETVEVDGQSIPPEAVSETREDRFSCR